jgi:hypothetical protein
MSVSFSSPAFGNGNYYQNDYHQKSQSDDGTRLAINGLGLAGASVLIQQASEFCSRKLMQGQEFESYDNIKKTADKMLSDNGLNGKIDVGFLNDKNKADYVRKYGSQMADSFETVAKGGNAFYMDGAKLAVAPESKPSLILHELGHAINAHKGKFMQFLQKSRRWAPLVPTALFYLSAATKPKEDKKPNWFQRNAGLIGFAAFTPTIVEEGMASLRGIDAAKKVLGNTSKLGALKRNYAFAWCTYLLAGIGLGVAAKQSVVGN